ncbi:Xaa-Pro peptidase family protein [Pseudomonas xanthomarina]|uniref:Xaa-Pro dipeptidase n=1 Tax=Stutzerimonas xanthomarina TaxID=271420 RepID=A0ABY0ZVH8_9GAMM|nr:Xaa-Pro peptidase family protein [Stutzerimonas xanthomarina]MCP9338888.1 Xaa-Pro peptidase family protein [Stutzerimonas xanthomarina]SEH91408.1 Xaa-Pro dipeptidase [Stutzerimonas xanthomarina]
MTIGVGGSTQEEALGRLRNMLDGVEPIAQDEYLDRIDKAQRRTRQLGLDAVFLSAGANLEYFTGVRWSPSERMVGAILPAEGALEYLAPAFEEGTIRDFMVVDGAVNGWQEHESPYRLLLDCLQRMGIQPNTRLRPCIGLCPSLPFFMFDGLRLLDPGYAFTDASVVTSYCRQRKSNAEIALMQRAKDMTLEVHKAAASILREGISTTEVVRFIELAHRAVGAPGSTFCIVLFGEASAFPHGVKYPQTLKRGDMVLIDTGCRVHSYLSDITRSYVFGEPSEHQRALWTFEKDAQLAAFAAARRGARCEEVDEAARGALEACGLGPDYQLPGLPHRTGHGVGLEIHESPYLVRGDQTPIDVGMCFSNEPMICVPGEFGIRLEDHFYMSESGPRWFTEPSHSIDDPFGLNHC